MVNNDQNIESRIPIKRMVKTLSVGKNVTYTPLNGEIITGKIVSRGGKVGGKYANAWNIRVGEDEKWVDFDRDVSAIINIEDPVTPAARVVIENAESNEDEILYSQIFSNHLDQQIINAKNRELQQWSEKGVYKETEYKGQKLVGLKWVIKPKIINGIPDTKARLVAKGFQENDDFRRDSPTCSKASIRFCLTMIATMKWTLQSIDISGAFLQSDQIDREVYVKPPKEAQTSKIWHLRKPIYGLKDASRSWYKKIRGELILLGCKSTRADIALFYWYFEEELQGIISLFVDDLLYGGTKIFMENVINELQNMLIVGSKHNKAFKYIGVNLTQEEDFTIKLDQNSYISSMKEISGIYSQAKDYSPTSILDEEKKSNMRSVVGQLNWLSSMSRPDLAFHACQMSTIINSATQRDIVKLNKLVKEVKSSPISLFSRFIKGFWT